MTLVGVRRPSRSTTLSLMSDLPSRPTEGPVKLVVWDLDDTLWRGTLSEGGVALPDGRGQLVRDLVARGVMVSISSRNDPDVARAELERLGLWELFVFPRIGWGAKGGQVRDLIDAAQLRAENALFVDDHHLNREEVRRAAPGIRVLDPADPGFAATMAAIVATGKPDPDHRRLADYRLLETRATVAAAFDDNIDFLRSCEITVLVEPATTADAERVHELIARTNQLNYTKRRVDLPTVATLLADPATDARVIRVRDRFGDHGLVGFAATRHGVVEHLTFSCRILGMGVERAVHRMLGSPHVTVVEPVAAPLDGPAPDWLTVTEHASDPAPKTPRPPIAPSMAPRPAEVLVVGGCDLQSAVAFVPDRASVDLHLNYSTADRPRHVVHRDSIDILLADGLGAEQRAFILETVPFLDRATFDLPDWSRYRHVIYSPLIDYVQAKYVAPQVPGFHLSWGDVLVPDIDEARARRLVDEVGLDAERVAAFRRTWRPTTKPDDVWAAQLDKLFMRMAGADTVTVVLGASRTFEGLDANRLETHRRANTLIADVAARHPNVRLVEIDRWIASRADFTDGIRHYARRVYAELGLEIAARIGRPVPPPAPAPGRPARDRRGLRSVLRRARPLADPIRSLRTMITGR